MTVHIPPVDSAPAVLKFWFDEIASADHWRKSPELDRQIAERFGALREAVLANDAAGWRETPETLLAAIILLDQFSRNVFRGTARAFEGDALARALTHAGLEREWDAGMSEDERQFLLMPLMHSEELRDQQRSVAEFGKLGDSLLRFATLHHDQIAAFGRFPGRNAALGRTSSAAEQALIDSGDTF